MAILILEVPTSAVRNPDLEEEKEASLVNLEKTANHLAMFLLSKKIMITPKFLMIMWMAV